MYEYDEMYCLYYVKGSERFSCYTDLCPFLKEQVFTLLWAHSKRSNKEFTAVPLVFVYYTDIYSAVTQRHVKNALSFLFFNALVLSQPPLC